MSNRTFLFGNVALLLLAALVYAAGFFTGDEKQAPPIRRAHLAAPVAAPDLNIQDDKTQTQPSQAASR